MKITIKPEEIGADTLGVDIDSPTSVSINKKISVEIVKSNKKVIEFDMNMRRALNGDLMIFEHQDIDIVIMLEKKKIVAFAKDVLSDVVYGAETRLMEHLRKSGVIQYDSVQGGNVFGSLQGKLHESKDRDPVKVAIYQIHEWLNTEKPYMTAVKGHDEMMHDRMFNPSAEYSTELGEVPHEDEKGSILQHNLFAPYLYGRYTY
tara:strand:+ start:1135 stop:1746 length:612 start_codon:yes stop_codon:yes gene_type:complete